MTDFIHAPDDTTCEAFILEAAAFDDHAKVTIWAHAPYNREIQVVIPKWLGGTDTGINWDRLHTDKGALDARFTFDANETLTGWSCGNHNFYGTTQMDALIAHLAEIAKAPPVTIRFHPDPPSFAEMCKDPDFEFRQSTGGTAFEPVFLIP